MIKTKTLGERMKEARDDKKCSLQDISNVVEISKQALSRYEHNKISPKKPTIDSLARYFNVSVTWLMGYDVDKNFTVSNTKERMSQLTIKLENFSEEKRESILKHFEDTINLISKK